MRILGGIPFFFVFDVFVGARKPSAFFIHGNFPSARILMWKLWHFWMSLGAQLGSWGPGGSSIW